MTYVKIIVFEGVQNLPLFAAREKGFFAERDLAIDMSFTPDSGTLRKGLADGSYQIAHTAVDNAIAMVELAGHDVAVIMGGDNGFNNLFFQPDIVSYEALRGRTVLVDAPNTAFALVLYRILEKHGLRRGDYAVEPVGATPLRLKRMLADKDAAAAIMNLPFFIHARQAGLRWVCEAVDEVGPYLSTAGFVMRDWARVNADTLVRYIQAYITGLRWALDPAHKAEAVDLLVANLRLAPDIATESYAIATAPQGGLSPDAHVDLPGLQNVLALRAHVEGQWGGQAPPADRYLDLTFYRRALETLA